MPHFKVSKVKSKTGKPSKVYSYTQDENGPSVSSVGMRYPINHRLEAADMLQGDNLKAENTKKICRTC